MRGGKIITCCWPGLSRLWLRGDVGGLLPAVAFAVGINCALWLSFGRNNPLGWGLLATIWLALITVWGVSTWRSFRRLPEFCRNTSRPEAEGLFIQAQAEYLKGRWFEAEALARQLLRQEPRDVEAQLLLASVYRRMTRFTEAKQRLQAASRSAESARWTWEISAELEILDRIAQEQTEDASGPLERAPITPQEVRAKAA